MLVQQVQSPGLGPQLQAGDQGCEERDKITTTTKEPRKEKTRKQRKEGTFSCTPESSRIKKARQEKWSCASGEGMAWGGAPLFREGRESFPLTALSDFTGKLSNLSLTALVWCLSWKLSVSGSPVNLFGVL